MLFDLFKAFDKIESSHKSFFFSEKTYNYLHACATCSDLSSNISTMGLMLSPTFWDKNLLDPRTQLQTKLLVEMAVKLNNGEHAL